MRRFIVGIVSILVCSLSQAQSLSITSFAPAVNDLTAMTAATRRLDQNGEVCALVRLETTEKGFVFDSGILGITDVSYHDAEIWLYLPKGTRRITISHPVYGMVRDYFFPEPLLSARTYVMKVETVAPPTPVRDTVFVEKVIVNMVAPRPLIRVDIPRYRYDTDGFATHFIDVEWGVSLILDDGGSMWGLSYSYVPGRMGLTTAVAHHSDDSFAFSAGPVIRLNQASRASDMQIYVGLGANTNGDFVWDVGYRIGWKEEGALSRYDVSAGLMGWGGETMMYFGLGCYSSGIAILLGTVLLAVLSGI